MKSFIYGIDGGDRKIFEYFEMPFYKELQKQHVHLELKEDLLNRGWSEIVTGAEGKDTGGFYMSPELGGTTTISMKYKIADAAKEPSIALLWDALPKNVKVGVMNVPSLTPVVPVNGFSVGSAGAGILKLDELTDDLVYPASAKDYLNSKKYIIDIRFNPSGIDDVDELFTRLKEMERIRVDCYIELCKMQDIDFGFLVDRATTVVQYLFMSEIKALMDRDNGKVPLFTPTPKIEALLKDFYSFVDSNIGKLVESLKPEQFFLTADHGHEPMTHHCNPNLLLSERGLYYSGKAGAGSSKGSLKNFLRRAIPRKYRKSLKGTLPTGIVNNWKSIGRGFDETRTLAFSHFHIPGIYINDSRFGGPVGDDDRESLIKKICEIFNEHPDSIEHGIVARPCRQQYSTAKYGDKLPDIRLDMPDYIFTTCRTNAYVVQNPDYGPVENLKNVNSDMHTGTKGSVPICLVDRATASLVKSDDVMNLTLIYRLVERFMEERKVA